MDTMNAISDFDEVDLDGDGENLSAEQQRKLAKGNISMMQRYVRFVDHALVPESAERFAKRLRDPANPITLRQVGRVYRWLMEQYGGRPTEPSSPSTNGHGGTGTESTVSLPSGEPTQRLFPPTDI